MVFSSASPPQSLPVNEDGWGQLLYAVCVFTRVCLSHRNVCAHVLLSPNSQHKTETWIPLHDETLSNKCADFKRKLKANNVFKIIYGTRLKYEVPGWHKQPRCCCGGAWGRPLLITSNTWSAPIILTASSDFRFRPNSESNQREWPH